MSQFFNDLNPGVQIKSDQQAAVDFYRDITKQYDESLRLLAEAIDQNESNQVAINKRLTRATNRTNICLVIVLLGLAGSLWLHFAV